MAGHSQQPCISDNTSNQTHNVPPYYSLSTQHSDTVLLSQHGVPQYQHTNQHGVLSYQQTSQPMPVVQQGVLPPYTNRPNTLPTYQVGNFPHQYNTVPVNQYSIFQNTPTVPQHSTCIINQQTATPQQSVPQYQGSAYQTSHPLFNSPRTPHPLPTAGSHLNPFLLGLPQEGVTGNMQQNIHRISLGPSLIHHSLSSSPSLQLPARNSPQDDSESRTDQFLHQQQTMPSMNTSTVDFSCVEMSIQSLSYDDTSLSQTTQSDNELINLQLQATATQQVSLRQILSITRPITELHFTNSLNPPPAKIIRIDKGGNLSQTHRDDSNNTRQGDNKDDDSQFELSDNHIETQPNPASSKQAAPTSDQCLNFQTLFEALYPARLKWHNLGLALGLDNTILECIREKERDDHDKCLRFMIQKLGNTSEKLTWDKISQALENPTVGMHALAQTVRTLKSPLYISRHSSKITSWCVEQYTNFLKDKYKEMSIFPDEWPPPLEEKFSKLALIERKQQILSKAKNLQSIEYDYATGNVDNIVTKKIEITLEQIFNPHLDGLEIARHNKFIVLMDGAPGVGKTTLTRKICIDWAEGKLLTDHQIVILKPLREMRGHTTASLSNILPNGPKQKEVIQYIQDKLGLGVMFIFDGFDELSSEQQLDKNAMFWKLFQGTELHKCSVLVTSRAYASGPLQKINRVNRHVEVLGFKRKDIERCIVQNIKNKKKAEKLLEMLRQRLDIVSLCYIPLNCRIVLYVYQQLGTLPDTLTQLYEVFILYTIKHYRDKLLQQLEEDIDDIQIEHANKIIQLPLPVLKRLNFLSKLAHKGMTEDQLVFEYEEIRTEKQVQSLGLLNQITCTEGLDAHYYQFLHLTIQEFLAARYLASEKSNEELLVFFKTKISENRFRMTLIFLSGLTKLNFLANETAFPIVQPIDVCIKHRNKSKTKDLQKKEKDQFIFFAHILYESQQATHNWLLPCLVTNSLDFSKHTTLTQFDCLLLANFLAMTPEDHVWDEINLSNCGLNSDCLEILKTKRHLQRGILCLCMTKKIVINTRCKEPSIDLLTLLLMKDSKVESLDIPIHHLPKSCKAIKDYDSSNKTLVSILILERHHTYSEYVIKIRNDELLFIPSKSHTLCSGVLLKLLEYSATIKYISKLHLPDPKILEDCSECNTSGGDAWESVTKRCRYVWQEIKINKRKLTNDDILFLTESLKYNRTLLQITLTTENIISYEYLVLLNISTQASVTVIIQNLSLSISNDNYVIIKMKGHKDISLLSHYLLQSLPPELQGVRVTIEDKVPKLVLTLLVTCKNVTCLTLQSCDTRLAPIDETDFQEMLENTQTLQTLTLDDCTLSDTFIKHLEDGLSHNTAMALTVQISKFWNCSKMLQIRSQNLHELDIRPLVLIKENVTPFFQIIEVCQQLKVLRVKLKDDDKFSNTITDYFKLLFQMLPSTSITTLEVSCYKRLGYEESLTFKEFVNKTKVLKVLKVDQLPNETFNGIIFTPESPLTELELSLKEISEERKTNFFNSLKSSCITILNISDIHLSESCTAFKQLLTDNKTLTTLCVHSPSNPQIGDGENNIVSCIAETLTQNCSLQKVKIIEYSSSNQEWTNLFISLHHNTTLLTLNLSESIIPSGENTESLCEMLMYNKYLQNLIINNKLIEGHYKQFAKAYTQRQPVLNLTVKDLDIELVEEIEKLQPSFAIDHFYIQH